MAKKLTYQEVKEYIESFNCKLLSDKYINTTTSLIIQCECGEIFERTLKVIKKSPICKCKKCTQEYLTKGKLKPFEEVIFEVEKRGYKVLITKTDYKGIDNKYNFICPKGHITNTMTLANFNKGHRCSKCYNIETSKRQTVSFLERKESVESFGFKILINEEEYENGSVKIPLQCPNGHIFDMSMHDFKMGNRCPICNVSKGEKKIKDYLDFNNIEYIQQYRIEDCKCSRTLPFDFYLPKYNILIEYDGKQHFLYGGFGIDLLEFMNLKYRDNIKTKYCEDNNIKLIRIPYWEFDNVEKILELELNL